ncbi:hypothetical protein A2U01_0089627, partial [Trifolium medium]|nr:hypothetical protein [Trifolium medium]
SSGCEDLYLKVLLGCSVSSVSISSPSDSGDALVSAFSGSESFIGSEASSSDT